MTRGALRRPLRQALAATLGLVAVIVLHVPHLALALRLWLVVLGTIALSALAGAALAGWVVGDGPGLRLRRGWSRRRRPERPRALEELEHAVDFSLGTAFDVHYRLRPHLARVAAHRLAARGVRLDTQPARALALLGPEAWDLVRPDRPEPEARNARGLDLGSVRRIVDRLHAV